MKFEQTTTILSFYIWKTKLQPKFKSIISSPVFNEFAPNASNFSGSINQSYQPRHASSYWRKVGGIWGRIRRKRSGQASKHPVYDRWQLTEVGVARWLRERRPIGDPAHGLALDKLVLFISAIWCPNQLFPKATDVISQHTFIRYMTWKFALLKMD